MNVVPLAAIKGGRAVELAWHTEEGKEVKGVDFNSIYIYHDVHGEYKHLTTGLGHHIAATAQRCCGFLPGKPGS